MIQKEENSTRNI